MVGKVLMPKATATWLIDNTALTFEQIADFCGMHILEVQALADREDNEYIVGVSPVLNGMVTKEDIEKCEKNPEERLTLSAQSREFIEQSKNVKSRYTPMAHRQSRPDGIAWIIKNHPNISDAQISKLLRTTKATIEAIRDRTHKMIAEIQPRNPVLLGICSEEDLTKAIMDADKKAEVARKRAEDKEAKALKKAEAKAMENADAESFEEEK